MERILVVSDSHKHNEALNKIFEKHPDIDTCIHCGDLQDNENGLEIRKLYLVRGNNDFELYKNELLLNIDDYQIYVTHGHMQDIEFGTDKIIEAAKEKNAHIVLYGHTHDPKFFHEDGIYFLNPGSVFFPRGGKIFVPTYAILTLDENIECHFYNAKTHECIDDMIFNPQPKKKKSFFSFFKK